MELEVTWRRVVRVWWAYFWRNLIAIVAAAVLGGILGAVIGAVMGALGMSITVIQSFSGLIGAALGIALSVVPMKLILGKDFGDFRLVLVRKD